MPRKDLSLAPGFCPHAPIALLQGCLILERPQWVEQHLSAWAGDNSAGGVSQPFCSQEVVPGLFFSLTQLPLTFLRPLPLLLTPWISAGAFSTFIPSFHYTSPYSQFLLLLLAFWVFTRPLLLRDARECQMRVIFLIIVVLSCYCMVSWWPRDWPGSFLHKHRRIYSPEITYKIEIG